MTETTVGGRYEQATDDLRLVKRRVTLLQPDYASGIDGACQELAVDLIVGVQRRYVVQDGELKSVERCEVPPDDPTTWKAHPQIPMTWFLIREEWRDVPGVNDAAESARELGAGCIQKISTDE